MKIHTQPEGIYQWAVFTDAGKGRIVRGDNVAKAVSNWRKAASGRGEPVAVIRCGWSETTPFHLQGTDVFGVICCVHKPEDTRP